MIARDELNNLSGDFEFTMHDLLEQLLPGRDADPAAKRSTSLRRLNRRWKIRAAGRLSSGKNQSELPTISARSKI